MAYARRAVSRSSSASCRTVRVSVVPHCTQPWVISSRLLDSAPPFDWAGATAVIAIRCPQYGQGSKKLGRFDRITVLKDTKVLSTPSSTDAILRTDLRKSQEKF